MKAGHYGTIEEETLERYRRQCLELWPQANVFQHNIGIASSTATPPSYSSVVDSPPPYSNNATADQ